VPQVRLIRKYAPILNGFDLSGTAVGDVVVVNDDVAAMLAREGWAEPVISEFPDRSSGKRFTVSRTKT
jgi:hypothetical protein